MWRALSRSSGRELILEVALLADGEEAPPTLREEAPPTLRAAWEVHPRERSSPWTARSRRGTAPWTSTPRWRSMASMRK